MEHKERQTRLFTSPKPLSTVQLAAPLNASEAALLDIYRIDSSSTPKVSLYDDISMYSSTPEPQSTTAYRKIGAGTCGAVFAQGGNSKGLAFKLAKVSDSPELWNDYVRHTTISKQFRRFQFEEVSVPARYFFVTKDTKSYFDNNPDLAMEGCI